MVLHNNGDYLNDLPKEVNIIYGTHFFDVVDLSIKEVFNSKSILKLLKKMVYMMNIMMNLSIHMYDMPIILL